ncbi:IS66 family insertion sequence element accessory protein TnpA [Marinifaba aquimaris]|uniref:IS66 family insertion sequence element accessory protein TnpA n=1 Tax=Marinifaba aquimaris TaxID=2741323 RepID=UPI003CCE1D17
MERAIKTFRSQDQWQEILVEQQKSGLTISALCLQHNISTCSFYALRKNKASSLPLIKHL